MQDIAHIFDEFAGMTADEIAKRLWDAGIRADRRFMARCALAKHANFKGCEVFVDYDRYGSDFFTMFHKIPGNCIEFIDRFDKGLYPFLDRAFPDARHPSVCEPSFPVQREAVQA